MLDTISTLVRQVFTADPAILDDPYAIYRKLRSHAPVVWVEEVEGGGSWHVFDYATTVATVRDPRLSAQRAMGGPASEKIDFMQFLPKDERESAMRLQQLVSPSMLTLDPPDHTRLRKLVASAFTPRRVKSLREKVQAITDELLDKAELEGRNDPVDLMTALAKPLPTIVIAELLGVPVEDRDQFRRWTDGGIQVSGRASKHAFSYRLALAEYLQGIIQERRAQPKSDLITALVAARDQNDALTEGEIISQCQLMLIAGYETTTSSLGSDVIALLRHPLAWQTLGEHFELIGPAVEELLRYESPFQFMSRKATESIEIGDKTVRSGDYVWFWIGSANHDPAQFPNSEELDFTRAENIHLAHLAFGSGVHYCLGAALARLELEVALLTLHSRYPNLRLAEPEITWRRSLALRGPEKLLVFLQ